MTVQRPRHRPSSPTVGLLPALGANGGINHSVVTWDGSRVSGEGGRIIGVFSLPGPPRGDRAALRPVNSDNPHIRTRRSL